MAMLEGTLWRCFDAQVGLVRMRSPSLRDTLSLGISTHYRLHTV
jgi:hypothetical protein